MKVRAIIIIIFCATDLIAQPFTTTNPQVGWSNCNICRIKQIIADKDYTKVLLEVGAESKGKPWVSISQWTALIPYQSTDQVAALRKLDIEVPTPTSSDPTYLSLWRDLANQRKVMQGEVSERGGLIVDLENGELNTRYSIKSKDPNQVFQFWLRFEPLPIGIEELLMIELIENGWEFARIRVTNPDTSPRTNWNEVSLKSDWENNGLNPIEGIYENTSTDNNSSKYKVGVKRSGENYDLIYLEGAGNPIWKTGDIKAYVLKTASPYLFKTKWYMSDKTINEDQYISFDNGIMKVIGNGQEQLYLKLYPTTTSDFTTSDKLTSSGTAFALSENGYIVTNHHVIQGTEIKVRGLKGDFSKAYNAKVVIEDRNNDLAIIKIEDANFTTLGSLPYKLDHNVADVGTSVFALGYPLRATMGDEVKLTNGIISSKTGFQGDITAYQLSVPVQPGNSGGPLFDSKGNIVGIINAKHALAENASYAIKTSYLLNLIQSMNDKIVLPTTSNTSKKGLSEQVKLVKEFVYIIETN